MENYLTIPEEILLLTIDQKTGGTKVDDLKTLDVVLASAILMNLAMENRIDTDLEDLFYISHEKLGNVVLDDAMKEIRDKSGMENPVYWITQFALKADELKELIAASLIGKGVLKIESNKLLWVFKTNKYPVKDNSQIIEVRTRVRNLVFSNEIPELRDMVILSLAHYGSIENFLFSDEEQEEYKERIKQIAKMDLIGQAISKALEELSRKTSLVSLTKSLLGLKTPEEKLDKMIDNLKTRFNINNDSQLPPWIRKGTEQYEKTLAFVTKKGTADVYYHIRKKQYFVRGYSGATHTFGGGA